MPFDPLLIICAAVAVLILSLVGLIALRTARIRPANYAPLEKPEVDSSLAARAAESLSGAIAFQTISCADNGQFGEWVRLREYLKERYPLTHEALEREIAGGHSLLFKWSAEKTAETLEPLLFCAHMDVVPASGKWTHPPFEGAVSEGYVWGRGALDCKNVMICLLEAAERLVSEGFKPSRDIYFAFGHDEEIGGAEGAGAIAKLFLQRGTRFDMVLDEGGALVRGIIPVGRPVAEVGVAEKGMVNVRLTAFGEAGHASAPPRHTALGRLGEAVARVEFRRRKARMTPVVQDCIMAIAPLLPYKLRMYIANQWLFKRRLIKLLSEQPRSGAMVRTTVAPTMAKCGEAPNVLPHVAEATLNVRLLHGDDEGALLAYLEDLTADLGIRVEAVRGDSPSAVSDYKGSCFSALEGSIKSVFGECPAAPSLMTGATDARKYEPLSPCIFRFMPFILTPDDQKTIHGPDERVMVEALGAAAAFYMDLIRRLAS